MSVQDLAGLVLRMALGWINVWFNVCLWVGFLEIARALDWASAGLIFGSSFSRIVPQLNF
jgi:hypothetical protein